MFHFVSHYAKVFKSSKNQQNAQIQSNKTVEAHTLAFPILRRNYNFLDYFYNSPNARHIS